VARWVATVGAGVGTALAPVRGGVFAAVTRSTATGWRPVVGPSTQAGSIAAYRCPAERAGRSTSVSTLLSVSVLEVRAHGRPLCRGMRHRVGCPNPSLR
jgi:hypothetical protein